MATVSQIFRKAVKRKRKPHKIRTHALRSNPQKRGIVNKIGIEHPKKPNSARRKVARVTLCTRKRVRVKIPGPGIGKLQKYSAVLIRGAHPRDLPGIRYAIIRGKLGSDPVFSRRKSPSKYGLKQYTILELKRREQVTLF